MTILSGPIASGSIVADIVRQFEAAIMAGELTPGERINEQATAKKLGVSRGALREALRQLEGRRLVERTANIGVRIAALSKRDVIEYFQVWQSLSSLAARLATKAVTPEEIDELRALVSAYATAGGNRQRNFDIHTRFHTRIVALSRNHRLGQMCAEINDVMELERFPLMVATNFFERSKEVIKEQLAVVNAMAAGDGEAAAAAMTDHLVASLNYHVANVPRTDAEPGAR